MSLGENIVRLRAQKGWSQGELAEQLEVSRQSISKWETDSSVPELDKLLRLSELFGVTLDELVRGECAADASQQAAERVVERVIVTEKQSGHKTAGVILLGFSGLIAVLLLLLGGGFFSLLYALPFLLCGLVCLCVRRRAGLWCAWAIYLCAELYLRYATGLTWRVVLYTFQWTYEMNYTRLIIGWAIALFLLAMLCATLYSFRRVVWTPSRKNTRLLGGGWALYFILKLAPRIIASLHRETLGSIFAYYTGGLNFFFTLLDYLRIGLFATLLIFSLAAWRERK